MHIRPDSLAFAHDARLLAGKTSLDNCRNLDGVRVRYTRIDERMFSDAVNRRRWDNVCARVSFDIRVDDKEVDVAVEGSVGDSFVLLDAEVVVDDVRRVLAPGIIR